jgi:anti-sigma28 factor (negative regulator of flagellin synthesis)
MALSSSSQELSNLAAEVWLRQLVMLRGPGAVSGAAAAGGVANGPACAGAVSGAGAAGGSAAANVDDLDDDLDEEAFEAALMAQMDTSTTRDANYERSELERMREELHQSKLGTGSLFGRGAGGAGGGGAGGAGGSGAAGGAAGAGAPALETTLETRKEMVEVLRETRWEKEKASGTFRRLLMTSDCMLIAANCLPHQASGKFRRVVVEHRHTDEQGRKKIKEFKQRQKAEAEKQQALMSEQQQQAARERKDAVRRLGQAEEEALLRADAMDRLKRRIENGIFKVGVRTLSAR